VSSTVLPDDRNVVVRIAPAFRGQVSPRDLIQATLTIAIRTDLPTGAPFRGGQLFEVVASRYHLEVGFTSSHLFIERNGCRLETLLESDRLVCWIGWEPTRLRLAAWPVSDLASSGRPDPDKLEKMQSLDTKVTMPPNSLLTWARKSNLLPIASYDAVHQFNEATVTSLLTIPDKVSTLGLQDAFWDKTYKGNRVISRSPKHEPDIQPIIHGLLYDIFLAKSIRVSPEFPIAGGCLDFLLSGHLATGDEVQACIEFKHAHSKRIENGLLKQLPTYMRALGCDFGLYCVMYFKGLHFSRPAEYENAFRLKVHLDKLMLSAGLTSIRILTMDFSYPKAPSQI
jgi:hypothetical protein